MSHLSHMNDRSFASWRSVLIGALLIPLNSYWHIQMTLVWLMNFPAILTLLFNVIFILLLLVAGNRLWAQYSSHNALRQSELLTIYTMLCTSTALCGYDMMQCLVSLMGTGTWYATNENEWITLFSHYLPDWLVVKDTGILTPFYSGESSFYLSRHLTVWLVPIVCWTAFVILLIWVMLCINVLLRKQWIEHERLAYPIVELPYNMTITDNSPAKKGSNPLANRRLWAGFAISGGISLLNGASHLYPSLPSIPIWVASLNRFATTKPWNAIFSMNITLYPFVMGLGFLMPLSLAVSYWAFYLFWQFQRIIGSQLGLQSLPGFPYPMAQVRGVWIALLLYVAWGGRQYFQRVLRQGVTSILRLGRDGTTDGEAEPMSPGQAVVGIIIGLSAILGFCRLAGMSYAFAFWFFAIYFALSIAITRIRAELGPPAHDMYGAGPDHILTTILGSRQIGSQNLSVMTLLFWLNRESYRAHPMPHQLEGFKLASRTKETSHRLIAAIMVAAVLGAISCFWSILHVGYQLGMESKLYRTTWFARQGYTILASRLTHQTEVSYLDLGFMGIGFVFTTALLAVRSQFLWWPFHPVGYAVSGWWIIGRLWFPLFISTILKWSILRFGGVGAYRKTIPFFQGLILGDFVLGSCWSIIGILFEIPTYVFWGG